MSLSDPIADGDIRLEPLAEVHRAALKAVCAEDPEIWPIYSVSYDPDHFDASFDRLLSRPALRGFALFLALWGIIVVGLSDNVVKPLLAKRGMQMHGAIVFFSLLGGLAVFGAIGLLLGPLIVAFFLTVVRIYERD